jgi:hypothetical protein
MLRKRLMIHQRRSNRPRGVGACGTVRQKASTCRRG